MEINKIYDGWAIEFSDGELISFQWDDVMEGITRMLNGRINSFLITPPQPIENAECILFNNSEDRNTFHMEICHTSDNKTTVYYKNMSVDNAIEIINHYLNDNTVVVNYDDLKMKFQYDI